jgi:DNA-directed RNA polymerase specialized sigma24 family protein
MNETRQSLLLRAQTGEENAWKDLTDLYRPLILAWLGRQGVPARDLEDLSQDVLLGVVKHLPAFEHSGHRGQADAEKADRRELQRRVREE